VTYDEVLQRITELCQQYDLTGDEELLREIGFLQNWIMSLQCPDTKKDKAS
jgi:hypothetical protein